MLAISALFGEVGKQPRSAVFARVFSVLSYTIITYYRGGSPPHRQDSQKESLERHQTNTTANTRSLAANINTTTKHTLSRRSQASPSLSNNQREGGTLEIRLIRDPNNTCTKRGAGKTTRKTELQLQPPNTLHLALGSPASAGLKLSPTQVG